MRFWSFALATLLVVAAITSIAIAPARPVAEAQTPRQFHEVHANLTVPTPGLLEPAVGVTAAIVHGSDSRQRLLPDTAYHRNIVYLDITDEDGGGAACTGTIVGPTAILTAAHCAAGERGQPAVDSIRIVPGKDGLAEPWGSAYASSWSVPQGWFDAPGTDADFYDFALLYLPDRRLTDRAGIFPGKLSTLSDLDLEAKVPFAIVGYAGDCDSVRCYTQNFGYDPYGNYQWIGSAIGLVDYDADFLYSDIDTWAGDSGAAVLRLADLAIVGVHSGGAATVNIEMRLNQGLIATLQSYCARRPGCSLNVASGSPDTPTPTASPTLSPTPTRTPSPTPTRSPVPSPTATPVANRPFRAFAPVIAVN